MTAQKAAAKETVLKRDLAKNISLNPTYCNSKFNQFAMFVVIYENTTLVRVFIFKRQLQR